MVLIAPTSQSARAVSLGPTIEVDRRPTRVLVEMLGAVEATYLGDLVGHLTPDELHDLDAALSALLGLE
jgi:mRNA interferase MazF